VTKTEWESIARKSQSYALADKLHWFLLHPCCLGGLTYPWL